jgi:hypothetical protein
MVTLWFSWRQGILVEPDSFDFFKDLRVRNKCSFGFSVSRS